MDLFETLNNYCERSSAALLAEPVNLLSNAAFLFAAWYAYRYAARVNVHRRLSIAWLCFWLVVVGIGSALFHSFATRWAMLADVIPIQIFILSFFGLWLAKALNQSLLVSVTGVVALYCVTGWLSEALRGVPMNGSEGYVGTILALYLLAVEFWIRKKDATLLLAAVVLTASLLARTIDQQMCAQFPIGTHFIWHLLNAYVCFLVISTYARAVGLGNAKNAAVTS